MKRLFFISVLCLTLVPAVKVGADNWKIDWSASTRMAGSSGQYMPFWARTGEDGILPVRSNILVTAGADLTYRKPESIFFEAGVNVAGAIAQKSPLNDAPVYGMVDRLYASAGWRMLRMDIGMKPRRGDFGELSITGGDMIMSGNARNQPGINLSADWIYFEKGHWVGIKGNLGHYKLFDDRALSRPLLHDKSVALKLALGRKVDLMAGFHHYALWGGEGQTVNVRNYVKMFFAKRGDESDSWSDRNNVFGNHLGNEWIRLVWRLEPFMLTLQYDKPFEDNSGMIFQNFPDGVWTLQFALRDRKAYVTDVTYEFINTMWQSGDRHDRPATEEEMSKQDPSDSFYGKIVLGGMDNYFNNSPYNSGWTYYGRTIGLPLLLPSAAGTDGVCLGIFNNRVRGHHLAIAGMVAQKVPYRFKATFTENHGTYAKPLADTPWQLSLALEADACNVVTRLPVTFSLGIYGDIGQLYPDSAGLTLRISYNGFRRF